MRMPPIIIITGQLIASVFDTVTMLLLATVGNPFICDRIRFAVVLDGYNGAAVTGDGLLLNGLDIIVLAVLEGYRHSVGLFTSSAGFGFRGMVGVFGIVRIFQPVDHGVLGIGAGRPAGCQLSDITDRFDLSAIQIPAVKDIAALGGNFTGKIQRLASLAEFGGNVVAAVHIESNPETFLNDGCQGHAVGGEVHSRFAADPTRDALGSIQCMGCSFHSQIKHILVNCLTRSTLCGIADNAAVIFGSIQEEYIADLLESGIHILILGYFSHHSEGSRLITNIPADKLVALLCRSRRLKQSVVLLDGLAPFFHHHAVYQEVIGNTFLIMNVEIHRAVGQELLHKGAVSIFIEGAGGAILQAVILGAGAFQVLVEAAAIELAEGAGEALVFQAFILGAGAFQTLVEAAVGDVALGAEGAILQAFLRGADAFGLGLDLGVGHPDGHLAGGLGAGDSHLILAAAHRGHVGLDAGDLVAGDGGEINFQGLGGLALVKGQGHILDGRDGAVGAHHELHGDGDGSGGLLLLMLAGGEVLGADGAVGVELVLGAGLLAGAGLLRFRLGLCLGAGAAGGAHGAVGVGRLSGAGGVAGAGLFLRFLLGLCLGTGAAGGAHGAVGVGCISGTGGAADADLFAVGIDIGIDLSLAIGIALSLAVGIDLSLALRHVPGVPIAGVFGRGLLGTGLLGSRRCRGIRSRCGCRVRSRCGCRVRSRCGCRVSRCLCHGLSRNSLFSLGKHRHGENRVEHAQAQKHGHHSLKHLIILLVYKAL